MKSKNKRCSSHSCSNSLLIQLGPAVCDFGSLRRAMLRFALVSQLACVHAYSSFRASIPNGNGLTGCDGEAWNGVGHLNPRGGGPLNPFGSDFSAGGHSWTPQLCALDSDGDGKTNGEELGDPSCQWTSGQTPQFTTGITHPGLNCGGTLLRGDISMKVAQKHK